MTRGEELAASLGAPRREVTGAALRPMLCAVDDSDGRILASKEHVFEPKLDGVRIVADKRGDRVVLSYRRTGAVTSYPEVVEGLRALGEDRVVLDGEIVTLDDAGKPSFQRLAGRIQARGRDVKRAARALPVAYVVFDVLAVGAYDVRGLPLEARRAVLAAVLGDARPEVVSLCPTFTDGEALGRACRDMGLEGVIAKRLGSPYRSGERSADWTKRKNARDVDLVVVGWTPGEGRRRALGALELASWDGTRFVARGGVGSGLTDATIDALLPRLKAIEVPEPVAVGPLLRKAGRRFVRPEIVVSVRYLETTEDGSLRAPVFRGVRADVRPEDCRLDAPDQERPALRKAYAAEAEPRVARWLEGRERGPDPCTMQGRRRRRKTLDMVFLRTSGASSAEGARAVCALARKLGLAAGVKTAGTGCFDVLVVVGDAPADGAGPFAEILATVARRRTRAVIEARAHVEPPWSVLPGTHGDDLVSLPIASDELAAWAGRPATIARARSRLRAGVDPLEPLLEAEGSFRAAAALLARLAAE